MRNYEHKRATMYAFLPSFLELLVFSCVSSYLCYEILLLDSVPRNQNGAAIGSKTNSIIVEKLIKK